MYLVVESDVCLIGQGLGHKCHYSLGSVALWSQVMGIPVVSPGVPKTVVTIDNASYYK